MSHDENTTAEQILRMRIAFALRRATGVAFDVDAMLSRPDLRARRLALWREAGCRELNSLLDQLESEFGHDELLPLEHEHGHAPSHAGR